MIASPAGAIGADCDPILGSQQVMRELNQFFDRDPEAEMRRADARPIDALVTDYKNNVVSWPGRRISAERLVPRAADLKVHRDGEPILTREHELNLAWDTPDVHRDLVTSLRTGDVIVTAHDGDYRLGAFVGWGGTTHLFEVAGTGLLLRVPRAVRIKFTNPDYETREEKTAFFYRAYREVAARRPILPLIDVRARDGLIFVEDLRPFYTAAHLANDVAAHPAQPQTALRRFAFFQFLRDLRGRPGLSDVFLDAIAWHPTRHEWVIADFATLDPAAVAPDHFHPAYAKLLCEAFERLGITISDLGGVLDVPAVTTSKFHSTAALPLPLTGIVTPLVTPFTADGTDVDRAGLANVIEHVLAGGVRGVMVLGTTGEANDLTEPLKLTMIEETCRIVGQRAPVLVNISSRDRAQTARLAQSARDFGAGAVVLSPPPAEELSQDQLLDLVKSVAHETNLPVFLYNIPQNTRVRFEPETVAAAARIPGVVGLKDSSGDLEYFHELQRRLKVFPNFSLMIGSESILARALRDGAHGGVSGSSNVWPKLFTGLYDAVKAGDPTAIANSTAAVADWKTRLKRAAGSRSSIEAFKAALARRRLIASPALARPATPWTAEEIRRLDANVGER